MLLILHRNPKSFLLILVYKDLNGIFVVFLQKKPAQGMNVHFVTGMLKIS